MREKTFDRWIIIYSTVLATAMINLLLYGLWHLLQPGFERYLPQAAILPDILFPSFIVGNGAASMLFFLSLFLPISRLPGLQLFLIAWLRMLFPLLHFFSLGRHDKRRLATSYIAYLNYLMLQQHLHVPARHILILAPHCLQWDRCPHKITRNISNCRQCGHCPVGAIYTLAKAAGASFAVATGGTLARQLVRDIRPQAIIAIACERDLISGMHDVLPLPVLGLLNKRPNGPCFNTDVDVEELRHLLELLTGEHYECT